MRDYSLFDIHTMPTIAVYYINNIISHLHNFDKGVRVQLTNYLQVNKTYEKRPKSFEGKTSV